MVSNQTRYNIIFLTSVIVSVFVIILGISIGSVSVSFSDTLSVLLDSIFKTNFSENVSSLNKTIITGVRLPRPLLAFLVGAAVSVCGCVLQSVLKNSLASAYSLGVSSASGLFIAFVMIFYTGAYAYQLMISGGILGGFLCVFFVLLFAQISDKSLSTNTVVLAGMVFSLFLNAIMTTLASQSAEYTNRIFLFQLGSFASKGYDGVIIMAIVLPIIFIILMAFSNILDILSFGDDVANSLGVNSKISKWTLILLVSALTSVSVAFAGIIGFVDLIVPHIVRRITTANHKKALPLNILIGGSFMVFCDIIARTILSPSEVPVGSITALIGAPFFIFVYLSQKKEAHND